MKHIYGILLIDFTTVILRIYETDLKEWKLTHYKCISLPAIDNVKLIGAITELILSNKASRITEWKVGARKLTQENIQTLASATGLTIENLSHLREQELLCKGLFTELW